MLGLECPIIKNINREPKSQKQTRFAIILNNINQKSAAMFGLDARIALAIFGALSVITGAALYKTITYTRAVALIADMNEVGKAWEQYYLDTGQKVSRRSDDNNLWRFYDYKIADLVADSGITGWKGPYLSYDVKLDRLSYNGTDIIVVSLAKDSTWDNRGATNCSDTSIPCYLWIGATGADESVLKEMDRIIDSSDGANTGDFRWNIANPDYMFSISYMRVKNPND